MIEWQTDEEGDEAVWLADPEQAEPKRAGTRPGWRFWLAVALILAAAGGVAALQIAGRIEGQLTTIRTDVRQSHAVAWQAAVTEDIELYSLFLSPGNQTWRAVQRLLLREHLLVDRGPLQLWLDRPAAFEEVPTYISVSPDYQTARVEALLPVMTQTADGRFQPVSLRFTNVYTRQNERWFLKSTDHDADFWGPMLINRGGRMLTLIYPQKDKGIARRLLRDLDALLVALCADPALHCPPGADYRLILSSNAVSLYRLTDNIQTLDIKRVRGPNDFLYETVLPTPTLVGYPADEAAYQALYRGYAGWLATVWIYNLAGADGLSHADVVARLAASHLTTPPVAGYQPLLAAPPPIPFPEAPVYVSCQDGQSALQTWQYSPQLDSWSPLSEEVPQDNRAPNLVIGAASRPGGIPEMSILDAIPREDRPVRLTILQVLRLDSKRTAILAEESPDLPEIYLLLDDPVRGLEFVRLLRRRGNVQQQVEVSRDGRFLTLVGYSYARTYLTLYDLEQEHELRYHFSGPPDGRYAWSPDGRWLVIANDRALRLVVPAAQYEKIVYHNMGGCRSVDW